MRGTKVTALVCAAAVVVGACSSDDGGTDAAGTSDTAASVTTGGRWSWFGYDLANSRYNPDEAVLTAGTAPDLAERWHLELGTGMSSTPAVVDGVVYFGDWDGVAHAVDADTGDEVWSTELEGQIMSSPTVDGDAVYVATNGALFGLDRATGTQRWRAETSDHPIAISPGSPAVVDDLVLQGTASGELMIPVEDYSFRGSVAAFDAGTGDEVWRVWFTEGDETSGAGVGVWSTTSIDTERQLAFIGTGNTYEPPASPLSDAIVAIDYTTGEIAWSTQFTYPDVWSTGYGGGVDGDVGAGPNLWEAEGRDLVGAGDKRGVYHALDRDTGEVVWETEMTEGSLLGGVIGTSALAEGRIYVASNVGDPESNAPTSTSEVLALDAADGAEVWRTELDGAVYAPVTVVPGVVLVGTTANQLLALAAEDGEVLWSMEVADQVGGGASVVDGTVYWGYGFALLGTGTGLGGLLALSPGGGGGDEGPTGTAGTGADGDLGAEVFRRSCSSCHGTRGQGGVGPDLHGVADRLTLDEHLEVVRSGRGSQMPAFGEALTDEEIEAVVEHERSLVDDG